ncbi:hypothetical protein Esti_006498 [Eimeria stiedai]
MEAPPSLLLVSPSLSVPKLSCLLRVCEPVADFCFQYLREKQEKTQEIDFRIMAGMRRIEAVPGFSVQGTWHRLEPCAVTPQLATRARSQFCSVSSASSVSSSFPVHLKVSAATMATETKESKAVFFSSLFPSWLRCRRGCLKQKTESHLTAVEEEQKKAEPLVAEKRKWDYKQHGADWAPPVLATGLSCTRQSPIEIDPDALQRLLDKCRGGDLHAEETAATGNLMKLAPPEFLLANQLSSAACVTKKQLIFDQGFKFGLEVGAEGGFGQLLRGPKGEKDAFQVQQFHFHAPAEHTLKTRSCLELHVVCKCLTAGKEDQMLVLSLCFDGKDGEEECSFLSACEAVLVAATAADAALLPKRVVAALQEAQKELGEGGDGDKKIDLKSMLPEDSLLIAYEGSLTTPPCTENVSWSVSFFDSVLFISMYFSLFLFFSSLSRDFASLLPAPLAPSWLAQSLLF